MLIWIAWNTTVLIFKQSPHTKLNYLKYNFFIGQTKLFKIELFSIVKLYLHITDLFEIEQFFLI